MKQSVFWQGFLVASLVATPLLVSGCKKKDGTSSQGSAAMTGSAGSAAATPPATGSGSATAQPAGSGSAANAAPGAPAGTANITAKVKGSDEGTFDKALYVHREVGYRVYAVSNCAKFNCGHLDAKGYDNEAFETDCPGYKLLTIDLNFDADAKPGDVQVGLNVSSTGKSNGITSNWTDGGKIASISDTEVKGSIDVKEGDGAAKGEFTATICK